MSQQVNTSTQQATTQTTVLNGSTSVNRGVIAFWLKSKTWLRTGKNRGPTRTCRICDTKLSRSDWYLDLDDKGHKKPVTTKSGQFVGPVKAPIQITICEHCVDKWAKELHKLNNDIQRNSTSEC